MEKKETSVAFGVPNNHILYIFLHLLIHANPTVFLQCRHRWPYGPNEIHISGLPGLDFEMRSRKVSKKLKSENIEKTISLFESFWEGQKLL